MVRTGNSNLQVIRRVQFLRHVLKFPQKYPSSSGWFSLQRSYSSFKPTIIVEPNPSVIDEPVSIKVAGLPNYSCVQAKLSLNVPKERLSFESKSWFRTSKNGSLDFGTATALPGSSYEGVDPMGIFWSMRPKPGSMDSIQTIDVTSSLPFDLEIFGADAEQLTSSATTSNEINWNKEDQFLNCLTSCTILRSFMGQDVSRIPIRHGQVRGTLFLPRTFPSEDKILDQFSCPLVLTMYGGIIRGHVIEERAAVLASKGFASMAVAFFGVDDLPRRYKDIRVEYFEEAIEAAVLAGQGQIDRERVGIVGTSKGGDVALSCVAFLREKIKAAVIINAAIYSVATTTHYKNQSVASLPVEMSDESSIIIRDDQTLDMSGLLQPDKYPDSLIPFADAPADLLFLAGCDDHNFDSVQFAQKAAVLMEQAGKTNFEVVPLDGMGHMCNLPYSPSVFSTLHPLAPPGVRLFMGGQDTPIQHIRGQQAAWKKMIQFLSDSLAL
ncbi:acyl-coenzyme A thioesterase 6-like isoform X4 [Tigriopus californicus]|nr:acyl-coenzyme A thioesterase 6-like isoform X4 [Tigriopus californicus]